MGLIVPRHIYLEKRFGNLEKRSV
eukprot:SAG31_NODE_33259_length_345_cov_16.833333_1_plen_24_part_10